MPIKRDACLSWVQRIYYTSRKVPDTAPFKGRTHLSTLGLENTKWPIWSRLSEACFLPPKLLTAADGPLSVALEGCTLPFHLPS